MYWRRTGWLRRAQRVIGCISVAIKKVPKVAFHGSSFRIVVEGHIRD